MKRLLLSTIFLCGCFGGGMGMSGEPGMMMKMGERKEPPWPTVRIDEPAGALVVMEQGVFGDPIRVAAPLEGQFQPTAANPRAGYPLMIQFDATQAKRFGKDKAFTVYARLNINQSMKRHGILVLSPSECELKALVAGDLEEVAVRAEILPTADQACRMHEHDEGHADVHADGQADAHGPIHTDAHAMGASCPHAGMGACPHGSMGACPHGKMSGCGHDKGCGGHGGMMGGMFGHGMFRATPPGATLTLRMTKF
jgi:hypothetical protein